MDSLSFNYCNSPSGILINLDFVLPDGSLSVNFDPAMVRALTPINPKRPHPREKGPPPGAMIEMSYILIILILLIKNQTDTAVAST